MNATIVLTWALWITGGGQVNGGSLHQTYVGAYFATEAECVRVQGMLKGLRWSQCIQSNYLVPK